ncbi:MAG TPA: 4-(cytidine 5'-diphospho)-2-C-methyl-D-erythritol kinase [Candidatus Methylomirabilis sp.]|nr:4-(cytidine 5'-diphospho)-2-C-methyl-D-erythritol kinase [Candidatus Methylomirabilis sp.]
MQARTVHAPAKLNVILEVLGRRPDGYHDLWSVLVLVDLCDTVTVASRRRGIHLTVRPPVVPAGPENLAFRAAETFFETWARPGGAAITLRKRIPVGAGLGGGSSDAAAVLAALNAMAGRPLTRERLLDLAAGLGSDVPFFFSGGAALVTGRGEKVADLPPPPPRWLVLALTGGPVSTAWAYGRLAPGERRVPDPTWTAAASAGQTEALLGMAINRLEEVVFAARPDLAALKVRLQTLGAAPVGLTGTGAALFGFAPRRDAARAWRDTLKDEGHEAWLCRTLPENPIRATALA